MRYGTKIHFFFSMYKREEKERDGELWERPSTLTSFHGREKEKKTQTIWR